LLFTSVENFASVELSTTSGSQVTTRMRRTNRQTDRQTDRQRNRRNT